MFCNIVLLIFLIFLVCFIVKEIYVDNLIKIYQPLPEWIFSNKCTKSIGCKYHNNNKKLVRNIFYQPNGFTSINFKNSNKNKHTMLNSEKEIDNKASQCLCFLANHEIIKKIMENNSWNVNCIQELDDNEYVEKNKICYGLNKNKGTKSIDIRLRSLDGKQMLSYDEIMTTMIHELVHNDISDHNFDFKQKQTNLREFYNSSTMWKVNWTD